MFWLPLILAKQPRTIQLEPTLFKLNSGGPGTKQTTTPGDKTRTYLKIV